MTESWRQSCVYKFGYTNVCILCLTEQERGFGYTLEILNVSMHVLETLWRHIFCLQSVYFRWVYKCMIHNV